MRQFSRHQLIHRGPFSVFHNTRENLEQSRFFFLCIPLTISMGITPVICCFCRRKSKKRIQAWNTIHRRDACLHISTLGMKMEFVLRIDRYCYNILNVVKTILVMFCKSSKDLKKIP